MKDILIMTPGPTYVHEDVRRALSKAITNPDLDHDFYEFYKDTTNKIKKLLNTKNDVLILNGEGILGLEAACASLIESDDNVLCIDNGIFGNGFGDFAKLYDANVTYFKCDYTKAIDVEELKSFLRDNNNFKIATLVHCETPSGITNPIDKICPILNEYNIISVVDSVSAIGGENVRVDDWNIDIILGGSQKCLSAPPGLTFLSVSEKAWNKILNRNTPIKSYYANLTIWKTWYEDKWFPYTQPISDIFALDVALDRILQYDFVKEHERIADAVRKSLIKCGLELYPTEGFSNTVTTVKIPIGINFKEIYDKMLYDHKIMIGGAFGFLKDKVFRIGHMGENCYEEKIYLTLKALDTVLKELNIKLDNELHKSFIENI